MLEDQAIEIFVAVDDFYKEFEPQIRQFLLESGQSGFRMRNSKLSESEMITILITFHLSSYRNFKAFYN